MCSGIVETIIYAMYQAFQNQIKKIKIHKKNQNEKNKKNMALTGTWQQRSWQSWPFKYPPPLYSKQGPDFSRQGR